MFVFYLSKSELSSFGICNTNKHDYGSFCCNKVLNHVDYVIKRDVYLQEMHSYSKIIRDISFSCSKNIRGISRKKYIMGVIARVFR